MAQIAPPAVRVRHLGDRGREQLVEVDRRVGGVCLDNWPASARTNHGVPWTHPVSIPAAR